MSASRLLSVDSVAISGDTVLVRGLVAVKLAELAAKELQSTRLRATERVHLHVAFELLEEAGRRYMLGLADAGKADAESGQADAARVSVDASSDRWVEPNEAAAIVGIGLRQLRRLAGRGYLRNYGGAARPRYSYRELVALRESRRTRMEA